MVVHKSKGLVAFFVFGVAVQTVNDFELVERKVGYAKDSLMKTVRPILSSSTETVQFPVCSGAGVVQLCDMWSHGFAALNMWLWLKHKIKPHAGVMMAQQRASVRKFDAIARCVC